MPLEGTFETIALPDVLSLLSVTSQTGELRVEAGGEVISVWLDQGRLAGFDAGARTSATEVLFALLRLQDASFLFHTGTEPVNPMEPADLILLLEEVERRLVEWPSIEAAIPSRSCRVELEASFDRPVALRADQWQLVAMIGSGRAVGDLLAERSLGEFEGYKTLKELLDRGLVKVGPPVSETAEATTLHPAKRRARGRARVRHVAAAAEGTEPDPVCYEDDELLPVALALTAPARDGAGPTSLAEAGGGEPASRDALGSLTNTR